MNKLIKESKILENYECIAYRDMGDYFKNLSKRKAIKKATYSVLYHPMLMLSKAYTITEDRDIINIKITADHIFLLCYLMGYIQDKCGADSYYGSNQTLSSDLGTSVRTVQRRLKDLADVGFIKTCIDDSSYRNIYINFEKIMLEISKIINPTCDFNLIFDYCHATALCFSYLNLLEKNHVENYASYLRMQYLLELSKNPITEPIRFIFKTLSENLKIDYSLVEAKCEAAREAYIKSVNAKS